LVGFTKSDTIYGAGGNDFISLVQDGPDSPNRAYGGLGNDYILDGDGDDFMNGGGGNDTVDQSALLNPPTTPDDDIDRIYGRDGDDTLDAVDNEGNDTVNGGAQVTQDTCTSDSGDTKTDCEL
jgi:Ca2+-binding RTX toxin-like protein